MSESNIKIKAHFKIILFALCFVSGSNKILRHSRIHPLSAEVISSRQLFHLNHSGQLHRQCSTVFAF